MGNVSVEYVIKRFYSNGDIWIFVTSMKGKDKAITWAEKQKERTGKEYCVVEKMTKEGVVYSTN